jgi:hypothetical protein
MGIYIYVMVIKKYGIFSGIHPLLKSMKNPELVNNNNNVLDDLYTFFNIKIEEVY